MKKHIFLGLLVVCSSSLLGSQRVPQPGLSKSNLGEMSARAQTTLGNHAQAAQILRTTASSQSQGIMKAQLSQTMAQLNKKK